MFVIADTSKVELIKAIGGLWPIVLCVTIIFLTLIFRKSLILTLPKLRKIKSWNTEIEIGDRPEPRAENDDKFEPQESKPPKGEEASDEQRVVSPADSGKFVGSTEDRLAVSIYEGRDSDAKELLEEWDKESPSEIQSHKITFHRLYCIFKRNSESFEVLGGMLNEVAEPRKKLLILGARSNFLAATDQTDAALETLELAFGEAKSPDEKIQLIKRKCEILNGINKYDQSLTVLESWIPKFKIEQKEIKVLYQVLAATFKGLGDDLGQCAALEKAVQADPTDVSVLFDAAYAQSANELSLLALKNYSSRMLIQKNDGTSQNNYAVQLAEFDLVGKAVDYYEKSNKNGETLAASNLAYLLIAKGFFSLAETILLTAQKEANHHENVDSAMLQLKKARTDESSKDEALARKSKVFQRFFRNFSSARIHPAISNVTFAGFWSDAPKGSSVESEVNSDGLKIEWGKPPKIKKITGKIVKRSFAGDYYEQKDRWFTPPHDKSVEFETPRPILGWLDEKGETISMLNLDKKEPDISIKLHRVPKNIGDEK